MAARVARRARPGEQLAEGLALGVVAVVIVAAALVIVKEHRTHRSAIASRTGPAPGQHGRRRRRREGPVLPFLGADNVGGTIPSNFFMTSHTCARCHEEIYKQWSSSAHHFSSFNNQWYRKSVEYMQDVVERSRRNGARAATITPSSSTAASTGRSRSRSRRRRRRRG